MTPAERAQLKALAQSATPGPWFAEANWNHTDVHDSTRATVAESTSDHDAAYIAAMYPQRTLALIAEVERLDALVHTAYHEGRQYVGADGLSDRDIFLDSDAYIALGEP